MKKYIIIVLLCIQSMAFAQMEFSETFRKTIDHIARVHARTAVETWLTEQDPMIGIVGRDLIGHLIETRDPEQLTRSATDVILTMLYLYRVHESIEAHLNDHPDILIAAQDVGWDREELLAYSSLYFYFSERIKFDLYISPYIFSMTDVKRKIESLRLPDDKKWVNSVAGDLIRQRRGERDLTLDVRTLELVRQLIHAQINDIPIDIFDNPLFQDILEDYVDALDQPSRLGPLYIQLKQADKPAEVLVVMVDLLSLFLQDRMDDYNDYNYAAMPFDLQVATDLMSPYLDLVTGIKHSMVDRQQFINQLTQITRLTVEQWLERSRNNRFRFDYAAMLASSYLNQGSTLDFTVLDQLRVGYFASPWAVYIYAGGFIDPLIKKALDETDFRIYLAGLGLKYHGLNMMVSAGIPYTDLKLKNTKLAFTIGYQIPLSDVIK